MTAVERGTGDEPVVPDDLWRCRPSIRDDVVTRQVDGQMLVWPADATVGSVDPVATVVLPSLDGTSELGEITEDFAIAAEVDDVDARRFVGHLVSRLAAVGVLDGLDAVLDDLLAPTADPIGGEDPEPRTHVDDRGDRLDEDQAWTVGSPERAAVVDLDDAAAPGGAPTADVLQLSPDEVAALTTRVEEDFDEEGRKTTTTYLADGSKIVSTEITVSLGSSAAGAQLGALIDGRSPAELAPGDTCLGSKLRNSEDVELVNVASGPLVSSVRCDHDDVRARLASLPGIDGAIGDQRGPVEAFVVRPYEGDGPVRVYDGMGRRRGRPRTTDEIVALVSEIIADDVLGRRGRVHLAGDLVSHGDDAVLLPNGALGIPRLARALRRCGLEPHWGRPVLAEPGTVEVLTALPPAGASDADAMRFTLRGVLAQDPQRIGSPRVELMERLLGPNLRATTPARAEALDALIDLTTTVMTVPFGDGHVDTVVTTVAALLGVPVPVSI